MIIGEVRGRNVSPEKQELLSRIEAVDTAIGRDLDALAQASTKHESADLWTRIRLHMAERRELQGEISGKQAGTSHRLMQS
jgi:hypothetical protein